MSEQRLDALFHELDRIPVPPARLWIPAQFAVPHRRLAAPERLFAVAAVAAALALVGTVATLDRAAAPPIVERSVVATQTPVAGAGTSYVRDYANVAELTAGADMIAVVVITNVTPITYGRLPFAILTAQVADPVKGSLPPAFRIVVSGPQMVVGERHLVFLTRYSGPIADDAYVLIGGARGDFPIASSGRIDFSRSGLDLAAPEFAVLRSVNGRSERELVAEVRGLAR